MLLLPHSPWEPALIEWCESRGSTIVSAGGDLPNAKFTIHYPHDTIEDVQLLTEVSSPNLLQRVPGHPNRIKSR